MKRSILFSSLFLFFAIPALAQGAPPVLVSAPYVTGVKMIYEPLQANPGQWSNMESGSYFYEWQRRLGGRWVSADDFDANYIPGNRDVGHRIRLEVTAINADGQSTARSPSYYIRGTNVNGVGIYPYRRGSSKLRGRLADWGRVACYEGYCKIREVRAKAILNGKRYRLRTRFSRGEIGPDRIGKIKVIFPAWMKPYAGAGLWAKMYVRASSTNGDIRARIMRTRIIS